MATPAAPPGDPDAFAGSLDWNLVWRARKERHLGTKNYLGTDEFWARKESVRKFCAGPDDRHGERALRQIAAMDIGVGQHVLDIGSGPGTLAVPLALRGCTVVAVEPSGPMRDALRERAEREGVAERIEVVGKRWEDVEIGDLGDPFDTVVASYSLSMVDLREALEKMDGASRGTIQLFWFLTPPPWAVVMHDLWPHVHGSPHHHDAMADVILMVLLGMGIPASLEATGCEKGRTYPTLGDAVDDFCVRMNCGGSRETRIIREHLRTKLVAADHGFVLRGTSWCARIWWHAGDRMEETGA